MTGTTGTDVGFMPLATPHYRIANVMMRRHGDSALTHASTRSRQLLEARDIEGSLTWLRIAKAVRILLATERPASARIH